MVEIRNETPLEVSTSSPRTLKPLEVGDYEPGDVAIVTFYVPQWGGRFMWIAKAKLPPVVTLDLATVARGQEPDALPSVAEFCGRLPSLRADPSGVCRLQVRNETIHVACAWVLDRAGGRELGRIAPGETWAHPCEPAQLWHFRTPSGLTLGVFRHFEWGRKEPPIDVALTTGFLDTWQTYQQQPARTKSKRGPGPLRLIGEQRASTPGADDQRFISASTVRLDISKEPFNGVENREVRDVEIAGSLLRWSGANRILSGYYGESNAADIRSLTIFCDRMEVADNLRFPRTNVTIHARELVFTGAGRIDTTRPFPIPSAHGRST